jgi:poly(3-hydroxybutyrate) depolymerase
MQQKTPGSGTMAIGEFGGAPAALASHGSMMAAPYYWLYEMSQASLNPSRALADATKLFFKNPANPLAHTEVGKTVAAACELFERSTRRYSKPEWRVNSTLIGGERVPVQISTVWQRPFCRLLHFERAFQQRPRRPQPRLLIVAPMSGHYATLLRGTVEGLLPYHDVYITDWADARMVPLSDGKFDLDDYIDYVISMLHFLNGDVHVLAVCQPSVPVMAAVARMEAGNDPHVPHSMVLMGGPIDTRVNPTSVNLLAERRGTEWFRRNVITKVPFPNAGFMRDVYPGFLQLHGFVSMNLERHIEAHRNLYMHLVKGDGDSAQKHREFYDEYLAVMDLCADYYLQTVDTVFVRHALPKGEMTHRGALVDPSAIRRVALLTVEGENDDISGVGQTEAAHRLCVNIPSDRKAHWLQPGVGHYGVFNGSRFRAEIAPRISDFILSNNGNVARGGQLSPKNAKPAATKHNGSARMLDSDVPAVAAARIAPAHGK